jgi:hypothetical protein
MEAHDASLMVGTCAYERRYKAGGVDASFMHNCNMHLAGQPSANSVRIALVSGQLSWLQGPSPQQQ